MTPQLCKMLRTHFIVKAGSNAFLQFHDNSTLQLHYTKLNNAQYATSVTSCVYLLFCIFSVWRIKFETFCLIRCAVFLSCSRWLRLAARAVSVGLMSVGWSPVGPVSIISYAGWPTMALEVERVFIICLFYTLHAAPLIQTADHIWKIK